MWLPILLFDLSTRWVIRESLDSHSLFNWRIRNNTKLRILNVSRSGRVVLVLYIFSTCTWGYWTDCRSCSLLLLRPTLLVAAKRSSARPDPSDAFLSVCFFRREKKIPLLPIRARKKPGSKEKQKGGGLTQKSYVLVFCLIDAIGTSALSVQNYSAISKGEINPVKSLLGGYSEWQYCGWKHGWAFEKANS